MADADTPTPEHTSPRIAALAAQVMGMDNEALYHFVLQHPNDVRSIAASALTQARDRTDKES